MTWNPCCCRACERAPALYFRAPYSGEQAASVSKGHASGAAEGGGQGGKARASEGATQEAARAGAEGTWDQLDVQVEQDKNAPELDTKDRELDGWWGSTRLAVELDQPDDALPSGAGPMYVTVGELLADMEDLQRLMCTVDSEAYFPSSLAPRR